MLPRALLVAALGALLLAPLAAAQVPLPASPGVRVVLDAKELRVDAGNETTLTATITNTGPAQGTVQLDFGLVPGWRVDAESRSIVIPAGGVAPVRFALAAPNAGHGAASAAWAVRATLTEDNTGRTATSEASVQLARVDPPAPPAPPGWTPESLALLVVGSAVLIAGIVVAERSRIRKLRDALAAAEAAREAERAAYLDRETGILLEAEGPLLPWGLRRELLQRLRVRNATARPRIATVGVREAPPGWVASVSLPRVPLGPGESALVTLYLNPDATVPGGAPTRLVLYAKPEEAQAMEERLPLAFDAPAIRIPEHAAPPSHDGAPRPALRL